MLPLTQVPQRGSDSLLHRLHQRLVVQVQLPFGHEAQRDRFRVHSALCAQHGEDRAGNLSLEGVVAWRKGLGPDFIQIDVRREQPQGAVHMIDRDHSLAKLVL